MKATGKTTIFDLTLNSPTATIQSVTYNWDNDTATIQLILKEENALIGHSRNFEMNTNGKEVTPKQVIEFIKKKLPDFE